MNYFIPIILIAWTDVIVKRCYVQIWLKDKFPNWADLPDFWKDSIPNDRWYRIRWVYVLTFGGLALTWAFSSIQTFCVTVILLGGLWEHIIFEWTATLVYGDYRKNWLWLHPKPVWLKGYPLVSLVAKLRGRAYGEIVASDVVVLGVVSMIVVAGILTW